MRLEQRLPSPYVRSCGENVLIHSQPLSIGNRPEGLQRPQPCLCAIWPTGLNLTRAQQCLEFGQPPSSHLLRRSQRRVSIKRREVKEHETGRQRLPSLALSGRRPSHGPDARRNHKQIVTLITTSATVDRLCVVTELIELLVANRTNFGLRISGQICHCGFDPFPRCSPTL
jgi:hypothetical protein